MRAVLCASACSILALVAGCAPTVREGVFACADDTECPSGFRCGAGRCRSRAGTECRQDAQCDDGTPCTEDVCENGYCGHAPDPTADGQFCDDGVFCNGADACQAGACVSGGVPPCPACDEASRGCTTCGGLDGPCCAGDICFDGGRCVSGTCTRCGSDLEPCCSLPPECGTDLACDYAADTPRCHPCGAVGQPCCFGTSSAGSSCQPDLACDFLEVSPVCRPCGQPGQPCCEDGCHGGAICDDVTAAGAPVCVAVTCPGVCPSTTICAPSAGGMIACEPCGTAGARCCEGGSCSPTDGPCYFGRCGGTRPL